MNDNFIASDEFLKTYKWRELRIKVLEKYDSRCMCCGRKPSEDIYLCVDHIKPRKTHPELALEIANLQILCNKCNHGKGNWSVKDWRGNCTFIITKHWLESSKSDRGGYTDPQLSVFGLRHGKLTNGWAKKLVGTRITEEQRVKFEEYSKVKQADLEHHLRRNDTTYADELLEQINQLKIQIDKLNLENKRIRAKLRKRVKSADRKKVVDTTLETG